MADTVGPEPDGPCYTAPDSSRSTRTGSLVSTRLHNYEFSAAYHEFSAVYHFLPAQAWLR